VEGLYPIRAVAKITGLSLDTLRAWERRYHAVEPEHTGRGRQYGPAHIERLLLLRQLIRQGHSIGQIAGRSDLELQGLLARPAQPAAEVAPALIAPVLNAIEAFDSARAADELSRLAALLAPRDLVYQVALPLMRETGIRWHKGTFAIAQEHLVSANLRSLLGGMMRLFRHSGSPAKMVLATPAGETHEFGILAAGMLAAIAGIEPVYLGANLPALEITRAVERTGARVLVVGVTLPTSDTPDQIRAIADGLPATSEFWVGGEGADSLDLSVFGRRIVRVDDLAAFESECLRWKN
jgi:DNA-binding transcriptional MerR regulator